MERHRYTPKEWHYNNRLQQKSCYNQQILTDRIINESHKLKEETKEIVVQNRKQTDHYLNERIETIAFNRNEIQQQRQEICSQIDSLIVYTERLNDFIKSLQNLSIRCERCIEIRENRLGVDLVRDNVEKELLKEKKLIRDTLKILIATVERSDEQMRRLRSAKYFIDRDLNDKDNALRIDEQNSCLNETQSDLQLHYNTSIYKPSIITPDDWQQFSNDNIERGAKEVVTARQLCSHIDNLLIQTPRDLNEQSDCVNEVLRYRIEDLKLVKDKLEKQHAQIVRQITELKQTILDLEESIADKRGFMALAQTRLNNRGQRSGMEQCKDTVEASLINEIRSLYANITQLQQMLRENQSSLRQLLKSQIQLEDEMNLKMNSIKIDETDCMTLHQSITYQNY